MHTNKHGSWDLNKHPPLPHMCTNTQPSQGSMTGIQIWATCRSNKHTRWATSSYICSSNLIYEPFIILVIISKAIIEAARPGWAESPNTSRDQVFVWNTDRDDGSEKPEADGEAEMTRKTDGRRGERRRQAAGWSLIWETKTCSCCLSEWLTAGSETVHTHTHSHTHTHTVCWHVLCSCWTHLTLFSSDRRRI